MIGVGFNEGYYTEAKPGAAGLIATRFILDQPSHKNAVMVSTTSTSVLNFILRNNLGNNPLDVLEPIGLMCEYNSVLVTSHTQIENIKDLVKFAKGLGRPLNLASPGVGSLYHVSGQLLSKLFDIPILHIPYSTGKHSFAVLSGEADFGFIATTDAVAWTEMGKIRPLLVTSRSRIPLLPNTPAAIELNRELSITDNISLVARKGLNEDFYNRMNIVLTEVLKSKEILDLFSAHGYVRIPNQTRKFHREQIIADLNHWNKIIQKI